MSNKIDQKSIGIYATFMEEIKLRTDAIDRVYGFCNEKKLDPRPTAEFGYLQLRMICELIALGCIAAHSDIPATRAKSLLKAWSASDIITRLENLHGDFYPRPHIQTQGMWAPDGTVLRQVQAVTEGYLSKTDLINLNGECGNRLHRGSYKQAIGAGPLVDRVRMWRDKTINLLNQHHISLIDKRNELWVIMRGAHDNRVNWSIMEKRIT